MTLLRIESERACKDDRVGRLRRCKAIPLYPRRKTKLHKRDSHYSLQAYRYKLQKLQMERNPLILQRDARNRKPAASPA